MAAFSIVVQRESLSTPVTAKMATVLIVINSHVADPHRPINGSMIAFGIVIN
jgi:hypothetical protein